MRHCSETRRGSLRYRGDITQVDRHPILGLQHDLADILGRLQQPKATDQELLASHVHGVPTDLAVVRG